MNTIVAINGSPKTKDSVSAIFIHQIESIISREIPIYQAAQLARQTDVDSVLGSILDAEVLLIVFPLYVDSLPAQLIKALTLLETAAKSTDHCLPNVYAICNCGFFEAKHNRLALDMIKNFCDRAGFCWCFGIGVGGGGMVGSMAKNMAKGPSANVYGAILKLCDSVKNGHAEQENILVTPKIPRFLYKLGGNIGWRRMIKANKDTDINACPHK